MQKFKTLRNFFVEHPQNYGNMKAKSEKPHHILNIKNYYNKKNIQIAKKHKYKKIH